MVAEVLEEAAVVCVLLEEPGGGVAIVTEDGAVRVGVVTVIHISLVTAGRAVGDGNRLPAA
jgi:hypothetical protein